MRCRDGLELLLLLLSLRDVADDHQELVVPAGGEASLVMACAFFEVERVLDHAGVSGERSSSRRQHAVGEVLWQAVPERFADDVVLDEIAWIRRVVGEIRTFREMRNIRSGIACRSAK